MTTIDKVSDIASEQVRYRLPLEFKLATRNAYGENNQLRNAHRSHGIFPAGRDRPVDAASLPDGCPATIAPEVKPPDAPAAPTSG